MPRCDVVVIGLGTTGSAALYQLSRSGVSVTGVDRYLPPHTYGSSHGQSRIIRRAIGEGLVYTPIALRATEIWRELERLSGRELFTECGVLVVAPPDHPFYMATTAAARQFHIGHELLDADQVYRRFPAVKMCGDETAYFEPGGGFLRPEACIQATLDLARRRGATVLTDVVTEVVDGPHGVTVSLDSGEQLRAGRVIVAAGSSVRDFVPGNIATLFTICKQTQYWFAVDQHNSSQLMPGRLPVTIWDTERNGVAVSRHTIPLAANVDGGLKFCAHDVPNPEQSGVEIDYTVADPAGFARTVPEYLNYVGPEIVATAKCQYTVTPDEDFIIDWMPGSDRVVIASPCSGHGFKHSAAVGEILAQLVTQDETKLDISAFALSRFSE